MRVYFNCSCKKYIKPQMRNILYAFPITPPPQKKKTHIFLDIVICDNSHILMTLNALLHKYM